MNLKNKNIILVLFLCLCLISNVAFAKGGSSGGGRSFSSGSSGFSSSKSSYSSSSTKSSCSSPRSSTSSTTTSPSTTTKPTSTTPSSSDSSNLPAKQNYVSGGKSFVTPRDTSSTNSYMTNYSTDKSNYSTQIPAYSTDKKAYTGSWDRKTAQASNLDRYPSKPTVGVYGTPPYDPHYYHNDYWSRPSYYHWFYTPNYHYSDNGGGYYEPNWASWIFTILGIAALGGLGFYLYRRHQDKKRESLKKIWRDKF